MQSCHPIVNRVGEGDKGLGLIHSCNTNALQLSYMYSIHSKLLNGCD